MLKKVLVSVLFWLLAVVITLASAAYQRRTGPTYPIEDRVSINGSVVDFVLLRSHGGAGDQPVKIVAPDTAVSAVLVYRRYKTNDDFTRIDMQRQADSLVAFLPHQPPAGKLEYHVEIHQEESIVNIPQKENAVTRFKGDVPAWALVPHIFFIFFAMLISTRTGLQALRNQASVRALSIVTLLFLILGGFIFGPIVQKFAFGDYWTGFPFGTDLTDNKTLIALTAWIIALVMILKKVKPRLAAIGAALVMLIIFLIPHSMHGSELDYSEMDAAEASVTVESNL